MGNTELKQIVAITEKSNNLECIPKKMRTSYRLNPKYTSYFYILVFTWKRNRFNQAERVANKTFLNRRDTICATLLERCLNCLYQSSHKISLLRAITLKLNVSIHINLTLQRTTKNLLSRAGYDLNSHPRESRPPLYQLSYRTNWDWKRVLRNLSARSIFVTT